MAEEMFLIKAGIDTAALKKDVTQSFEDALSATKPIIENFNKKAEIKPTIKNITEVKASIAAIDKELEKLSATREIKIKADKKELDKLDKEISKLTERKEIILKTVLDSPSIKSVEQEIDKHTKTRDMLIEAKADPEAIAAVNGIIASLTEDKETIIKMHLPDLPDIENQLKDLTKEKELKITANKQEINEIDKQLKDLTKEKEIRVKFNEDMLRKLKRELKDLGDLSKKTVIAITAITAAFTAMAIGTSNALDRIDKSSQKLNLSIQTFQELDFIASQTGTSVDGLGMAMRTLTVQAAKNGDAFKALGISVKNSSGEMKTQEELFFESIKSLQGFEAGVGRSKAAFELFGRSAAELNPLINSGVNSLEDLRQKAHDLGLVFEDDVVKQGAAVHDALDQMKRSGQALMISVMTPLLPTIQKIAEGMAKFANAIKPIAEKWLPALVPLLAGLVVGIGAYIAAALVATGVTASWAAAWGALTAAMVASGIGWIPIALGAIVTALVAVVQNWEYLKIQATYSIEAIKVAWKNFIISAKQLIHSHIADIQKILEVMKFLPGALGFAFNASLQAIKKYGAEAGGYSEDFYNKERAINDKRLAEAKKNRDKLLAELKKRNKAVATINDDYLANLRYTGEKEKKEKEDPFVKLLAEYQARVEIAKKTITDEQKLGNELLNIRKDYLTKLLGLLENQGAEEIKKRGQISEQTIALSRAAADELVEINRELRAAELRGLEDDYDIRVIYINQIIKDEKKKREELKQAELKYQQDRLKILEEMAEEEIKLTGQVSDETFSQIQTTMKRIKEILEENKKTWQEWAEYVVQSLSNIFDNLISYMKNYTDAQVQIMKSTLKAQQTAIDNALKAQLASYDEALAEFENIEKKKTEIAQNYADALREIEQEKQDHATLEEWEALEERRLAAEEAYNQRMAIAEEEEIRRQELLDARSQAEADALAEKERLEKEFATRSAQLQRKNAIFEKKLNIMQAIMNTAVAITKAISKLDFATAAIVAAMGAIQVAAINAAPLPEIPSFYTGGIVPKANAQNGYNVPPSPNPKDKTLAWLTEGERVLSLKETELLAKMENQGWHLQNALAAQGQNISQDNSRVVHASLTLTAKEVPTWTQARHEAYKFGRRVAGLV